MRSTVRCAVRGAIRGAGLCLQGRATAAATFYRSWVLEGQETRAVRQVIV